MAKALNVPVLIWGGRDRTPVPGEIRVQDTQCGLFATTKGLLRSGTAYSYIVNCHLDDQRFSKGYLDFLAVASVVQAFRKKMRILQIGARPRPFFSVMYNESDVFSRFGIEVVPHPYYDLIRRMESIIKEETHGFRVQLNALTNRVDCSRLTEANVKKMCALTDVIEQIAIENDCYAIASECWTLFPR